MSLFTTEGLIGPDKWQLCVDLIPKERENFICAGPSTERECSMSSNQPSKLGRIHYISARQWLASLDRRLAKGFTLYLNLFQDFGAYLRQDLVL